MSDGLKAGHLVDRVVLRVEAGKIAEFARATGASDPVHGHRDDGGPAVPVATLTHSVATAHRRDQRSFVAALGLAIDRVVVGDVAWEYRRPLRAGDVLEAVRRVEGDERKEGRSGTLRLVRLTTEFTDPEGVVVLVQRETLIERPAPR